MLYLFCINFECLLTAHVIYPQLLYKIMVDLGSSSRNGFNLAINCTWLYLNKYTANCTKLHYTAHQ